MKIVVVSIVLLLVFFLFVRYLESMSLFFPQKEIEVYPQGKELPFENIFFETEDRVKLHGWLFVHPSAKATLLFFHGNAGNISHRLEKIALFYQLGLNVFIIDYRGYGKSQGVPSEQGLYKDAVAAFDYLKKRLEAEGNRIVGYGESLGGAVVIDLALQRSLASIIVDSSFSSAADMARQFYPFLPTFLLRTKMDSMKKIGFVKVPKLFIHSEEDEIVPFALAQKLFSAAPAPKAFLKINGDHNHGYALSEARYMAGIKDFLAKQGLLP